MTSGVTKYTLCSNRPFPYYSHRMSFSFLAAHKYLVLVIELKLIKVILVVANGVDEKVVVFDDANA